MKRNFSLSIRLACLAFALLLAGLGQTQATTVSCNPTNGATGVSPNTHIVFTFSGAMYTAITSVICSNLTAGTIIALPLGSWTAGNTVLTFTPTSSLPGNSMIGWWVHGYDALFQPLTGTTNGTFTTGGSSGGSGTNAVTTFSVSKINWWDQYSAASPVVDPNIPYYFAGMTTLASNRTATYISLTLPTGAVTNLTQNPMSPESYFLVSGMTSSNAFATAFPQGTNTFYVSAPTSNQTVRVVLPMDMTQPNPPHITNFVAAQSVNPSQDFTLRWDSFVGGANTDEVYVVIGNSSTNVWKSSDAGAAGALNGTATSVTIPANSLQANSNYTNSFVGFYHAIVVSNATYVTTAFRVTATWFSLNTVGSSAPRPVVTNFVKSGSSFSFDVVTTSGQALTVVSSTNSALALSQWPILLSTNSPGTRVHVTDPRPATNRVMVYRVRNGS